MTSSGPITLRLASLADADLLFAWRNDTQSRQASRNVDCVKREEHQSWLSRTLGSDDHRLMIAEVCGKPAGVVRADRVPQGWELSWTVAPQARGHGVGRRMLVMFVSVLEGRLVATIRSDNVASMRMAAAAGLSRLHSAEDPQFEQWARE
jgi:RimJ/RimL family protein N-acetyltransferase